MVEIRKLTGIIKYGTIRTNNQQKYNLIFYETSLKLAINYLLDKFYFILSTTRFRQMTGIPMGSDPAGIWKGEEWELRHINQF